MTNHNPFNPTALCDALDVLYRTHPVQYISTYQLTHSEWLTITEYIQTTGLHRRAIDLLHSHLYRHSFHSTIFVLEEVEDRYGNITLTFTELIVE